jgi:hypothetical protein
LVHSARGEMDSGLYQMEFQRSCIVLTKEAA